MYARPFDTSDPEYHGEPTDEQARVVFRALVHWATFYPERTVGEILHDIVSCNAGSTAPLDREELLRADAVFAGDVLGIR